MTESRDTSLLCNIRKISRGSCSSSTAQMGIQRCVEAIMEDLENIEHLIRDQVIILIRKTDSLPEDRFYPVSEGQDYN